MNEHARSTPIPRITRAAEGLPRWRWTTAIIGGLIGAAILMIPQVTGLIPLKLPPSALPVAGAIAGYFLRK